MHTYILVSYYALLWICYCFSHLICLFSVIWLFLLYKFTPFFISFLFLSEANARKVRLYYTYWQYTNLKRISDFETRVSNCTIRLLYISKSSLNKMYFGISMSAYSQSGCSQIYTLLINFNFTYSLYMFTLFTLSNNIHEKLSRWKFLLLISIFYFPSVRSKLSNENKENENRKKNT